MSRAIAIALSGMLALAAARSGAALEAWTPETGRVELEELPRDEAAARYRHAVALVAAGQTAGGLSLLRELTEANPDAEWVPQARSMMARALLAEGRYRRAFRQLGALAEDYPDTPLAERARELRRTAARLQTQQSVGRGLRMYEELIERAESFEEAALLQKEKADALLAAERYLQAEDEYLVLISRYPRSAWVPYAWLKVAECEWRLARWLDLGLERLREAERAYTDYLEVYPDHAMVGEAREQVSEVRSRQAQKYRQIAEFYMLSERRPWAAVNYLRLLTQNYADTEHAEWAQEQLERVGSPPEPPLRGERRTLKLPGVATAPGPEPNSSG